MKATSKHAKGNRLKWKSVKEAGTVTISITKRQARLLTYEDLQKRVVLYESNTSCFLVP